MENKKSVSKTRKAMELAATYLASGDNGRKGLDPQKVEASLWAIGNWKKWFVFYMEKNPLKDSGSMEPMGHKKACELADSIFTWYYENEVRAFNDTTGISTFWARNPGNVEFGCPEEDVVNNFFTHKDEQEVVWGCCKAAKDYTPFSRMKSNYGELLVQLAKTKDVVRRNKVMIAARKMLEHKAISWKQFHDLSQTNNNLKPELYTQVYMGLIQEPVDNGCQVQAE